MGAGLDQDEIDALEADGIISARPQIYSSPSRQVSELP
jgi:hypothetical protein